MPLRIAQGDITQFAADAIVNAANFDLIQGGGVCGAIFAAAGERAMRAACAKIGHCAVGEAVATGGFRLPAAHVIHTVGPIWRGGGHGEEELLRACYRNSLALAKSLGAASVAFPLISGGIYGYPKEQAYSVAVSEIGAFLLHNEMDVTLLLYQEKPVTPSAARYVLLRVFIETRQKELLQRMEQSCREEESEAAMADTLLPMAAKRAPKAAHAYAPQPQREEPVNRELTQLLKRMSESFSSRLLRLIDERNMTDPEVYQRANLDRRLFSKIRGNPAYRPSKNTALALAVALKLNFDETTDLIRRAGYALSPSSRFDLIVEYYIRNGRYNIFEINEALFAFGESQLGA